MALYPPLSFVSLAILPQASVSCSGTGLKKPFMVSWKTENITLHLPFEESARLDLFLQITRPANKLTVPVLHELQKFKKQENKKIMQT